MAESTTTSFHDDDGEPPKPLETTCHTAVWGTESYDYEKGMMVMGAKATDDRKPNFSKASYLMVALAMLAGAGYGVYALMDHRGIVLRKPDASKNPNYLGEVSMAELALHNTPEDCWLELHGSVYDLTDYAKSHPGGAAVLTNLAGRQATDIFALYHVEKLLETISSTTLVGPLLVDTMTKTVSAEEDTSSNSTAPIITLSDVAQHTADDDLWVAIHGIVYDLTNYNHPGGRKYLTPVAGTDASAMFDSQHPKTLLLMIENFIVGALAGDESTNTPATSPTSTTGSVGEKPVSYEEDGDEIEGNDHGDTIEDNDYSDEIEGNDYSDGIEGNEYSDETEEEDDHDDKDEHDDDKDEHDDDKDEHDDEDEYEYEDEHEDEDGDGPTISPVTLSMQDDVWSSPTTPPPGAVLVNWPTTPLPTSLRPTVAPAASTLSPTVDNRCYVQQYTLQDLKDNYLWMAIYGQVYDFGTFLHPGGAVFIVQGAGTDATALYETKHKQSMLSDSKKGGTAYLIGELADVTGKREVVC